MGNRFDELLQEHELPELRAESIGVVQCNILRTCNLACAHCHVESSPKRSEQMSWETMQRIVDMVAEGDYQQVDLTGGAPEMHPHFRPFVAALCATGVPVQIRSNLTIMEEDGFEDMPRWLADHGVAIVASLPCYLEDNVDKQRGKGVYNGSVRVLQRLNAEGYAQRQDLPLHLVFNPTGPSLPAPQQDLESAYRAHLREHYDIEFSGLYTIANMPIGRWARWLATKGELGGYLVKLEQAFNPETVSGLMCRHQLSIDWDGRIYDCDFHLALGMEAEGAPNVHEVDLAAHARRRIVTANHCLGCTAGCGSSCGGALTEEGPAEQRRAS